MAYNERGDTLVEVLMSIVVLSIVVVGAVTLMVRGLGAAQNAVEHSAARQEVNGQMELLRYLRDKFIANNASPEAAQWSAIVSGSNGNITDYSSGCSVTPAKAGTAFYVGNANGTVTRTNFDASLKPVTFATAGRGMWIEARPSTGVSPAYVDFVIRACWEAANGNAMQQTVTAERLYDPSR